MMLGLHDLRSITPDVGLHLNAISTVKTMWAASCERLPPLIGADCFYVGRETDRSQASKFFQRLSISFNI